MEVEVSRLFSLIIDFGLLIMVWVVHLAVYPAFQYFKAENLYRWHRRYTFNISVVVMPLMLLQVFLHGYQLFKYQNIAFGVIAFLILFCWFLTFMKAVPLHSKIDSKSNNLGNFNQLLKINIYRAIIWTSIFTLNMVDLIAKTNVS